MKLQYPGHELAFWTGFWILLGGFAIWLQITEGKIPWYMGLMLTGGMFGLGIWFRIRPAGYMFLGMTLLLGVGGFIALPFAFELKKLAYAFGHLCAAHATYEWLKANPDDSE